MKGPNENDEGIIDEYCQYNEFYPKDDNMDIDLTLEFDVDEGPMDQLKAKRMKDLLKARQYTSGNHHGKLNPLPPNWRYPNKRD